MKQAPRSIVAAAALGLLSSGLAACGGSSSSDAPGDKPCQGEKCDQLPGDDTPLDSPCDSALFDRSGRGFLPERLKEDALFKHVYMDASDGCPVDMRGIMEVLKKNDDKGCSGNEGITSHVVSERAQLNGTSEGASYRLITSRTCDDRPPFGLLFSLFGFADVPQLQNAGLHPGGTAFPGGVEIIAFDERNGVFNYYKEVGGKMGFFGSSTDYVTEGPGGPNLTDIRGCANCHPGGGLNMKELENPWLHWEERPEAGFTDFERTSPGADELIKNRADILGVLGDGPQLEQSIIKPGNAAWNERRIKFVNENGTVADVLKPLFCPVQVNIQATFNKRRVNHNIMVDPGLLRGLGIGDTGRINTREADYDNMLRITGSNVPGSSRADVRLPMAFVNRSPEDNDYVEQLIDAGIVDREFVNDVLMVDFTRPAFSDERCDLLEFAPELPTAGRTPDALREGFLANLDGAQDGTPAGQLKAHLQARVDGTPFDHTATVEAYLDACNDRQQSDQFASIPGGGNQFDDLLGASEFHMDMLKIRSLLTKLVSRDGVLDSAEGSAQHRFEVFEFPDSLPTDSIQVTNSADPGHPMQIHPQGRLSPADCSLVSEFVSVGEPSGNAGGGSCPGACGEFVNGASCQCDDRCAMFGNCCDGWEPVLNACPGEPFEFVNGASCQCDDRCDQFGNCCDGWAPMCL